MITVLTFDRNRLEGQLVFSWSLIRLRHVDRSRLEGQFVFSRSLVRLRHVDEGRKAPGH